MKRYIGLQKIIELGSFSKAADALGYTQSAMSQMIASLEQELSMTLLKRSRTGISLTAEGKELYPYIVRTLNEYTQMKEKANDILGLESGTIRMGTLTSISTHWMPNLIKQFKKIYPNVNFLIHQGDYTLIPEWIESGTIDFGFMNPHAMSGFSYEVIKEGSMLAVLPENHPLGKYESIPLEELTKDPFILLEEGRYYEPMEAFHAKGLTPNIHYTIHDDYSIMAMVEAGLGISILAGLMLRRTRFHLTIRPTNPLITRTIAIAYKDKKSLPMASRRFIDFMMKQSSQLP